MARIDELFNSNTVLNYYKDVVIPPRIGEILFPPKKIQGIKLDIITGADGLPVTASVHAFDSATELASREAIEAGGAKLALIKRKIRIGEEDIIMINSPRTKMEQDMAIDKLFNDSETMVESVKTRAEAMRMELLTTGEININENGLAIKLDYKVPRTNKLTFDWSDEATAKPFDDIKKMTRAIKKASGFAPDTILTSEAIIDKICACVSVRKAILGVNFESILDIDTLNAKMKALRLPKLQVYGDNDSYRVQKKDGKYESKQFIPDNVMSFFKIGQLGESIYGLTAEEIELIGSNQIDEAKMVGNIFVGVEKTTDPVARYTKAATTFLPTLKSGASLGIATVTLS
ncbi:major capsid protein [Clostridium perfringens]|nr:major capsid protein [Clostridium perfringens]MDK0757946.1 major capsid protein [Clostridium perfringens]